MLLAESIIWQKERKKDFSCADRKFVHNIGLLKFSFVAFKTPEECFIDETPTTKFEY